MRSRLTRRTAFRFTGLAASIITLINFTIFTVLYVVISQELGSHLQTHVNEIRKTFVGVKGEESDGFQELGTMITNRVLASLSDENIYLLTDENGKYVSGNILSLDRFHGWRTIS